MNDDLTAFYRAYRKAHGQWPTMAEAGSHLGVSYQNIEQRLIRLVAKGLFTKDSKVYSRAYRPKGEKR